MKLKVIIEPDVHKKLMHWVNKSNFEVSGLGNLVVEPDGVLRVVSAILLPQVNGPTHTDIEADAVCKAMFDLKDSKGMLKWWWHSHVQMPVFWSGTDHDTIKSFGHDGWILATVFNQKYELKSAFYSRESQDTPWGKLPLFVDGLDTKILTQVDPRTEAWDKEYAENVKVNIPVFPTGEKMTIGVKTTSSPCKIWTPDEIEAARAAHSATKRPKGMTKKEWKKIKATPAPKADDFQSDEYGFNQSERKFLADGGFTENQVDELIDQDFTGLEILQMSEQGFKPDEILFLIEEGYEAADIMAMVRQGKQVSDDVPVADRRRLC